MKTIPLSIKAFLLISTFGLVVFYNLPMDEFGAICGSNSLVPLGTGSTIVLLPLIVAIIDRRNKKISNATLVKILIVSTTLFLAISLHFISFGCSRCKPSWMRTIADMRQLSVAQEIFYKKNNKYADTQEELMEIISVKFKELETGKEITDKDGKGIEGGDNDPETWSATCHMSYKEFNDWCRLTDEEYWYTCNQDGCYKEQE
ncbi:MAG: hypothetical protein ABH967_00805 [Patescibacteria group bacterium]